MNVKIRHAMEKGRTALAAWLTQHQAKREAFEPSTRWQDDAAYMSKLALQAQIHKDILHPLEQHRASVALLEGIGGNV